MSDFPPPEADQVKVGIDQLIYTCDRMIYGLQINIDRCLENHDYNVMFFEADRDNVIRIKKILETIKEEALGSV